MTKDQDEAAARKRAQRGTEATSCSSCGSTENLHRHHPNIETSDTVRVLCAVCHTAIHKTRGDR